MLIDLIWSSTKCKKSWLDCIESICHLTLVVLNISSSLYLINWNCLSDDFPRIRFSSSFFLCDWIDLIFYFSFEFCTASQGQLCLPVLIVQIIFVRMFFSLPRGENLRRSSVARQTFKEFWWSKIEFHLTNRWFTQMGTPIVDCQSASRRHLFINIWQNRNSTTKKTKRKIFAFNQRPRRAVDINRSSGWHPKIFSH